MPRRRFELLEEAVPELVHPGFTTGPPSTSGPGSPPWRGERAQATEVVRGASMGRPDTSWE